jgi:hypothetical protein
MFQLISIQLLLILIELFVICESLLCNEFNCTFVHYEATREYAGAEGLCKAGSEQLVTPVDKQTMRIMSNLCSLVDPPSATYILARRQPLCPNVDFRDGQNIVDRRLWAETVDARFPDCETYDGTDSFPTCAIVEPNGFNPVLKDLQCGAQVRCSVCAKSVSNGVDLTGWTLIGENVNYNSNTVRGGTFTIPMANTLTRLLMYGFVVYNVCDNSSIFELCSVNKSGGIACGLMETATRWRGCQDFVDRLSIGVLVINHETPTSSQEVMARARGGAWAQSLLAPNELNYWLTNGGNLGDPCGAYELAGYGGDSKAVELQLRPSFSKLFNVAPINATLVNTDALLTGCASDNGAQSGVANVYMRTEEILTPPTTTSPTKATPTTTTTTTTKAPTTTAKVNQKTTTAKPTTTKTTTTTTATTATTTTTSGNGKPSATTKSTVNTGTHMRTTPTFLSFAPTDTTTTNDNSSPTTTTSKTPLTRLTTSSSSSSSLTNETMTTQFTPANNASETIPLFVWIIIGAGACVFATLLVGVVLLMLRRRRSSTTADFDDSRGTSMNSTTIDSNNYGSIVDAQQSAYGESSFSNMT